MMPVPSAAERPEVAVRLESLGRLRVVAGEPASRRGGAGGPGPEYEAICCGVCRTDAKMYREGQRDLVLPRVPGHELVLRHRPSGERFVPWPATSCGACAYCLAGRDNLCEDIRIMGFHFDGGYARYPRVDGLRLFKVEGSLPSRLYAFFEPTGCVVRAFSRTPVARGDRAVIYGAGTLGLIAAAYASSLGAEVTLIERDERKVDTVAALCERMGFTLAKASEAAGFDLCVNACADYVALAAGITKLRKGGRLLYFSGATKNESLETNLLNLIHYKELVVEGSYGLASADVEPALAFIEARPEFFASLIHRVIAPERVEEAFSDVLSGLPLKYVIDFDGDSAAGASIAGSPITGTSIDARPSPADLVAPRPGEGAARPAWLPEPRVLDLSLEAEARFAMDDKAKPLGSLGALEDLAVRLCVIKGTVRPSLERRLMLTFAADHGIVEEGVSAFPREVSAQMVSNFVAGGAAINVICGRLGIELRVVDMGVDADLGQGVVDKKVRRGTRNCALTEAMTTEELERALRGGMEAFLEAHRERPVDMLGVGEMGIGNTSSAALLIASLCGIGPEGLDGLVGRGTGVDDAGLEHKRKVLRRAYALHRLDRAGAWDALRSVGGYEIAGMAGAAIAAASEGVPTMLDGVISTAAGLCAYGIEPSVREYLFIGHRSVEVAQGTAARGLGLEPIVDLGLRLGEGTGAALAMDLAATACALVSGMASFDEARISRGTRRP